jgi:hypothetical protein
MAKGCPVIQIERICPQSAIAKPALDLVIARVGSSIQVEPELLIESAK